MLVTEYLEGALPEGERERFEAHLATCRHCVTYVRQMRTTIRVVGHLSEDQLSPAARDELLTTFRAWKRGGQ